MSNRYSVQRGGRDPQDPWFRIGPVHVTTTVLVTVVSALSFFVVAVVPSVILATLADRSALTGGQVWRLVSWPLVNYPSIWAVLAVAMFWYFGSRLEELAGRVRIAWFYLVTTLAIGLLAAAVDVPVAGIDLLELMVLLVFIAEYPHVRFFFGIPGWVIGVVLVAIQVLGLLAGRQLGMLLVFVLAIVVTAFVARASGFLTNTPVPNLRARRRPRPRPQQGQVVVGPWADATSTLSRTPTPEPPVDKTTAELDALLDKIHSEGMDSLTSRERKRLEELRKKRQRG